MLSSRTCGSVTSGLPPSGKTTLIPPPYSWPRFYSDYGITRFA
ncbi:hypothetical protein PTH_0704 [Pelotomaculum thermopropionicum SI]|uniref:Uncharacterized protein n=1 Tax=Pelotomaculum thermopropionicum (strain DSM 13744 / JCM 10971 / SI) TaxID=370438 RepID=A5D4F4_PELTS|nr:hypothetical protein PTH_0704 [Pelotomaculum thermopropionicum SI]